jgi:hypothetical protein
MPDLSYGCVISMTKGAAPATEGNLIRCGGT